MMRGFLRAWLGLDAAEFIVERTKLSVAALDARLMELEVSEPQEIEPLHPIACPHCARSGLVRISVIEEIDRHDPTISRPVGFGLYCPHRGCRKSFYWRQTEDGNGKTWSTDEALDDDSRKTADATDAGSKPAAPAPRAPSVRWRPGGRR